MGYPIYHSQYTAAQIEASIGKTPRIKAATRTWEIWDISTSAYVDTGVSIDTELFVDSTLTEAGYAADAKVTGDKLGELKSALQATEKRLYDNNTFNTLPVSEIGHYTVATNGLVVENNSYDTFLVDTTSVKTFILNGSTIKVAGYYSNVPQNGSIAIDNTRHLDLPQGETTVPAGCNYLMLCVLTGETSMSATTGGKSTEEKIADLTAAISAEEEQIDNLQIEGYTRVNLNIDGTSTTGIYNGSHISVATWTYKTFSVEPDTAYYVTGSEGVSCALCYQLDENNNPVTNSGLGTGTANRTNVLIVTNSTTTKMIVNSQNSFRCVLAKKQFHYVTGIAEETGTDNYTIGTGKFKTVVDFYGSNNGTFNYDHIDFEGNTFKNCLDDVTPLYMTDVGYLGANHGFSMVYDATLSNHGLTVSDIGKTCTIDGKTWILLKVKSTSIFTVGCVRTSGPQWTLWSGFERVSPTPTTFNFGSSITVTSIASAQLFPSVKNVDVRIVQNDSGTFSVAEHYQIIAPSTGIQDLIDNVGHNDNDSLVDFSDPAIDICNLYTFSDNGACVVTSVIRLLISDIKLLWYGGTQSMAFTTSDYYSVPMTSFDSMRAGGSEARFTKSTWLDENEPPIIYCQADGSLSNSSKMFIQGVLVDNRLSLISSEAGFISTARKMYPFAVDPNAYESLIETVSFRLPAYKNEMDAQFKYVQYCKVGKAYYVFIGSTGAASGTISIPGEMNGRKITTVVSKNATCNNTLVAGYLDVTATGESYLLLKLDEY